MQRVKYLTITDDSASADIARDHVQTPELHTRTDYVPQYLFVLFQALNQQCSAEDDQDSQMILLPFLSLVYLTQPHNGQL